MNRRQSVSAILVLLVLRVAAPWGASAKQEADRDATVSASDASETGSTLVPLPVLLYEPETGLGFGVAANYYTRLTEPPAREERVAPPSLIQLIAVYTVKSQIITSLRGELYLGGTQHRLFGDVGYVKFPTRFWGVGNGSEADAEEDYTPERVTALNLEAQRELTPGWYFGPSARVFHRRLLEATDGGLIDSGLVPGTQDGWAIGVGVVGARDTRNSVTFPTRGVLHQMRATVFGSVWGSDFEYRAYALDLRRYLPLGKRRTVAVRTTLLASSGTPPFDQMPQIGGDQLLRGYFQGRFTDRQLMSAQVEYRGPAFWRLGWVGFGGLGQVADTWGGFEVDGFKASIGGGLRFLVSDQEGLFIRADLRRRYPVTRFLPEPG